MSRVCPSWLSFMLYNPLRKQFTDREKIICESKIGKNSTVLEVGAGNGFLTEVMAETAEKIVVVELQEGMVRKLGKRIGRFGDKVEIITSDISSVNLETGFADVCVVYYCFHEVSDQPAAVRNIARSVKGGGMVSIYEPTVEVGKKTMADTVKMFSDEGFIKEAESNGLFTRFVRMRKKENNDLTV
jgi:tRNA A58 N-methylase Trm61